MPELDTARARAGLERLREAGLAGEASRAALEALIARAPRCHGVLFELVLGPDHPGEVDLALRLEPEAMEGVLVGEPGLQDWRELAVPGAYRGWVERDTARPDAPLSVFAQYAAGPHPSEVRGVLKRLGAARLPGPQGRVRHLGVLHGREAREIRVVLSGVEARPLATEWGLAPPAVELADLHLAVGLDENGLRLRHGLELSLRRRARLPMLPSTPPQREVLAAWPGLRGAQRSHAKWVGPTGEVKVYLAILG